MNANRKKNKMKFSVVNKNTPFLKSKDYEYSQIYTVPTTEPITPDFVIAINSWNPGQYAVLIASNKIQFCFCASSYNSLASLEDKTNGFSQSTCFPASKACFAFQNF